MNTRFGFVSTFPPTQCGLATFAASLREELVRPGVDEAHIVRLIDARDAQVATGLPPQDVITHVSKGSATDLRDGVAALNDCDVAIIQHEFGIFGGRDGEDVLPLLDGLEVPSIVVLHTVLTEPTAHQREVLEGVVAKADAVVTMTVAARDRLIAGYDVDADKVSIIAHGARRALTPNRLMPTFRTGQPTILTWGLLGPGKGIEWAIEAMPMLRDLNPMPHYIVAGQTHPQVLLREGEAYRDRLRNDVRRLGLTTAVTFDGHYRKSDSLAELVQSADIVLLPYDSEDQVTSGVLIEAVAAGKPVIATRFPHAVELLASGAGIVVSQRSPNEIADALRTLLTRRDVAARMAEVASATAPALLWPAIAGQYRDLASELITARVAA